MTQREPATRDKERTRQAIIEAASAMITAHGAGVSLADIAAEAGVSKGALTHHFASRNALEQAVLTGVTERFWDEVQQHVDSSENRAGMLLRGYVRAVTENSDVVREIFSPTLLMTILGFEDSLHELLVADAEAWREAFAQDGIDFGTSLVVRFAVEGLAASADTPFMNEQELLAARTKLLELTEQSPAA